MSPRLHEFTVFLERRTRDTPWGIRLCGGVDLNAPLIITKVTPGSCAQPELMRGDIVTKIEDYDARDLRHEDAQMLFKNASNQIKIVVRRDDNIALKQCLSNDTSRCPSTIPPQDYNGQPHRVTPVPHGSHGWATALQDPTQTLPHTEFPHASPTWDRNDPTHMIMPNSTSAHPPAPCSFPPPPPRVFSPQLTRDYQQDQEDDATITNQPYRTTPLILPGAKIKRDNLQTESYLRHHPNPAMRAGPQHDYNDTLMKQKLADSILQRVVGEAETGSGKVVHKQFNSPIGLYSQSNIENTIKSTVPNPGTYQPAAPTQVLSVPLNNGTQNRQKPTKIQGYKPTVVFDPLKSETYRALLDDQEASTTLYQPQEPRSHMAEQKVFQPNRMVPGKKPTASFPPPQPEYMKHVNAMGEPELIQQSHSFKRLMHHVLTETEY